MVNRWSAFGTNLVPRLDRRLTPARAAPSRPRLGLALLDWAALPMLCPSELHLACLLSLAEIAHSLNPLLQGWINYYGRYAPSALAPLLRYVNQTLLAWAMRKFKRFRAHKIRASQFLQKLTRASAHLFVHWRLGMTGVFA